MSSLVIVGNGGAALSALRAISSLGEKHQVTLISQEDCPAYSPMLTPYYVSGDISYRQMFLCGRDFYRRHRARVLLGRPAVAVDPAAQRVILEGGEAVGYDKLLIATGSTPVVPPIPGVEPALTLWSARDARRLREGTRRAKQVAVIGAGLIGLQVVEALHRRGKGIVLIEMLDRVLPRVLDGPGAALVAERLQAKGVDLRLREQVKEIRPKPGGQELRLASGAAAATDAVVLAAGVRPNADWVEGSGLALAQGIVVDQWGQTNMEHIYAAGDVAQATDAITGHPQVNATWGNAIEQGWLAGLNMAGKRVAREQNFRLNILTPLGLPVASLGLVNAEERGDDEVSRGNDAVYRKLVFRQGRLVGAVLVGEVEEAGILANLMQRDGLAAPAELARSSAFLCMARPLAELYRSGKPVVHF